MGLRAVCMHTWSERMHIRHAPGHCTHTLLLHFSLPLTNGHQLVLSLCKESHLAPPLLITRSTLVTQLPRKGVRIPTLDPVERTPINTLPAAHLT